MSKSFQTELKPPECSQCKNRTEYYCRTCKQDLCVPCKEEHVLDLDTKHHDVVIDRLKYGDIILRKTCERHPNMACEMWCLLCKLPVCSNCVCVKQISHETQDIKSIYKHQCEQHQERIFHVKSEIMLHNHCIQAGIRSDFRSCQTEISKLQENMIIKGKRLKDWIDEMVEDIREIKPYLNSIQNNQRRHIKSIQTCEHRSEQLANKAIQFLLFSKKNSFYKINDTLSASIIKVHALSKNINKDNVFNCLGRIQTTETRKRQARSEQLFKVISPPMVQKTFKVKPTWLLDKVSLHISCVTPGIAWVSSWNNLNLTDTAGNNVLFLKDKCNNNGVHTVTKEGSLVYIDREYNINKLSLSNETKSTLMRVVEPWKPYCIYCSPSNGDFLIGMMRQDKYIAKVARYNNEGKKLQHNPGQALYVNPRYITENQNGDVIVSDLINNVFDLGVIVVTDSLGTHRFSYKGDPQASEFKPHGICTDALSHILVCDAYTKTVQMIDKDGQFLAVLLTEEQGLEYPYSLSYDYKSHLLWVGSLRSTTICIYRHIERHGFLKKTISGS
ncbi:uncharacterized protein LOC134233656 [Saccostrea cucullata]|uniref:uncharacterized protein LOC134233656 n=1 Tax=Saccostrea cuccullata TaxID=36930 RepID=UPI002ED5273C